MIAWCSHVILVITNRSECDLLESPWMPLYRKILLRLMR